MTVTEIITLVSILLPVLVGEQILFWRQIKKVKAAEGTSADTENSIKLVELQSKYIDLIEGKDQKIRELQNTLLSTSQELTVYKTLHCDIMECALRHPPLLSHLKEKREKHDNSKTE